MANAIFVATSNRTGFAVVAPHLFGSYEEPKDGALFQSSIQDFCIMPVSGKPIMGLADEIMEHYSDYSDLYSLMEKNLKEHLI